MLKEAEAAVVRGVSAEGEPYVSVVGESSCGLLGNLLFWPYVVLAVRRWREKRSPQEYGAYLLKENRTYVRTGADAAVARGVSGEGEPCVSVGKESSFGRLRESYIVGEKRRPVL